MKWEDLKSLLKEYLSKYLIKFSFKIRNDLICVIYIRKTLS